MSMASRTIRKLIGGLRARAARRRVGHLELHVTHACNLACESCSHYSNYNHRGHLELSEADRWMDLWSHRFQVDDFHLLGGEPTIHPELPDFVSLVRRHWPTSFIHIRTNGFFLHRHPRLPALLSADGRASISLAVHHNSSEYRERLRPIVEVVEKWRRENGVVINIHQSVANWTRRYHGIGTTMQPFEDGAPRVSWEISPGRSCKQLFEGKTWKCPPLAYLKMQKDQVRSFREMGLLSSLRAVEPELQRPRTRRIHCPRGRAVLRYVLRPTPAPRIA